MEQSTKTAAIAATAAILSSLITAVTTFVAARNRIEDATKTATLAADRADAVLKDTEALRRYIYDNGTLSGTSLSGGKMIVRINGSNNAGPASIPVDMNRLSQFCGDDDGCTISLGANRWRELDADGRTVPVSVIEAPLFGGPCRFSWSSAGKAWSVSQYCAAVYALTDGQRDTTGNFTIKRPYQIYEYSNVYGTDDSMVGGKDKDRDSLIVLGFKGACYFAEAAADPRSNKGSFMPDSATEPATGKGLYLIAGAPGWDTTYPRDATKSLGHWPPDDPSRRCELVVED